jgi:hypothetical protein
VALNDKHVTGTFTPGEVQILEYVMRALVRGGTPHLAVQHREFATLCTKVTRMREQLKAPKPEGG